MAKRALGSGLDNLFGDISAVYEKVGTDSMRQIQISAIHTNPMQPRKEFDDESLQELANSIEQHGLLQPVVVCEKVDGSYTLIAGERRLRACKLLGKDSIQAIIIDAEEHRMRELALIENIQREDLNPIDLALSYVALLEEHNITQEQLAKKIQKSRTQITNTMRLLDLSKETQKLLIEGKLTQGHAKMLIGLSEENEKIALQTILGQKLNVRETENLARKMKAKDSNHAKDSNNLTHKPPYLQAEELARKEHLETLQKILQTYNITSTIKNNTLLVTCNETSNIESLIKKLQKE